MQFDPIGAEVLDGVLFWKTCKHFVQRSWPCALKQFPLDSDPAPNSTRSDRFRAEGLHFSDVMPFSCAATDLLLVARSGCPSAQCRHRLSLVRPTKPRRRRKRTPTGPYSRPVEKPQALRSSFECCLHLFRAYCGPMWLWGRGMPPPSPLPSNPTAPSGACQGLGMDHFRALTARPGGSDGGK